MSDQDSVPCGCEGHSDNEELCQYPRALEVIRELRQKLALAGLEGSPPPGGQGTIPQLRADLASVTAERDAAFRETGKLRTSVTEAIGLEWGTVCPDDVLINKACADLKAERDAAWTRADTLGQQTIDSWSERDAALNERDAARKELQDTREWPCESSECGHTFGEVMDYDADTSPEGTPGCWFCILCWNKAMGALLKERDALRERVTAAERDAQLRSRSCLDMEDRILKMDEELYCAKVRVKELEADHSDGEKVLIDALNAEAARVVALEGALRDYLPYLPQLDDGPVRFSAQAQAAGRLRAALKEKP